MEHGLSGCVSPGGLKSFYGGCAAWRRRRRRRRDLVAGGNPRHCARRAPTRPRFPDLCVPGVVSGDVLGSEPVGRWCGSLFVTEKAPARVRPAARRGAAQSPQAIRAEEPGRAGDGNAVASKCLVCRTVPRVIAAVNNLVRCPCGQLVTISRLDLKSSKKTRWT